MILEEIKAIAETWFEWPTEKREQVTYTSAMLFAREMYERGQRVERDKTEEQLHEYISNEAYKSHGREATP